MVMKFQTVGCDKENRQKNEQSERPFVTLVEVGWHNNGEKNKQNKLTHFTSSTDCTPETNRGAHLSGTFVHGCGCPKIAVEGAGEVGTLSAVAVMVDFFL